jgi:hypothetical protein
MQPFIKIARSLSSPVILIVAVWCAALLVVAVGPIDYPLQPSVAVLALVVAGVSLFIVGYLAGVWSFRGWLRQRRELPAAPARLLNIVAATTSLVGIAGIGMIAFDRMILSGVSNGGYAELLRCAPVLVDFIEIKRTPLLYAGYLTFSFGFASLVLFLLKGEEIRGWPAILAQLSIVSPVGYALLYSGRMPILFAIILIVGTGLVRVAQGRAVLPRGHHLLVKLIAVLVLFGVYTNAMWSSRRNFCVQMSGLIQEMLIKGKEQETERVRALQTRETELKQKLAAVSPSVEQEQKPAAGGQPGQPDQTPAAAGKPVESGNGVVRDAELEKATQAVQQQLTGVQRQLAGAQQDLAQPRSADAISATNLSKMIDENKTSGIREQPGSADVGGLLATMQEAWQARPRPYVISAIESGRISAGAARDLLSTYFYLTHGVRVLDIAWRARAQFSPQWGVYEIGIFSPILRVFFPESEILTKMSLELKSAEVYGFFPTAWAAAYIDFGAAGAMIYILIWGFAAGWSHFGARHTALATPAMLLTFFLASVFFSPIQGPLGIANSAMVLLSMAIVGLAIDLGAARTRAPGAAPRIETSSEADSDPASLVRRGTVDGR